jgi:DNA invertase Pin-like site-specific DNA recombinase
MLSMSKRIATYLRVSTSDQTIDSQRLELQEYCQRRGWSVVAEYTDCVSGAKFSRSGLDGLMKAVRRRHIDVILCVKLDRLGRSLPHLAGIISELDGNGVALVCSSQSIDTSDENPAGRLIMHVLMAVAEFERSLIRERTRAGLKAAKARGVKFGAPRALDAHREEIARHRQAGASCREISAGMKIPLGSVFQVVRELRLAA